MSAGRKLKLKARAARQAETRQRIVDAAIGLHLTAGPAHTTIAAIADAAGVQRQTVYAHFPDARSLLETCSAHVRAKAPPPDVERWLAIADPAERLATALEELYAYFRRTARGWTVVLRDAETDELVREIAGERRLGYLAGAQRVLATGWKARGARRRALHAAIGLAVDFRTWERLALKEGLEDREAAALISAMVKHAG